MTLKQLKETASGLPLSPGVYIMYDVNNAVIYVGKAKKLKNRVSQYFQDSSSHSAKTRSMVSKVDHFEVIVAASEFEALILECSLIKQHLPKYNILLKDDKGFPHLRLDMREIYPVISIVNKVKDDGAMYFGPFASRGVTNATLKTINSTLLLPTCNKRFPRDIGRGRPCLNYHLKQCAGWCQMQDAQSEYRAVISQAEQILRGNYRSVMDNIKLSMQKAADELNFELAAVLRDKLNAVESLRKKQFVVAGTMSDMDVIGYANTETKACFAVIHFRDGALMDKDYEIISVSDDPEQTVSALIKQYYLLSGMAPPVVLLPFSVEDAMLFSQLLEQRFGHKTKFLVPQRGEKVKLTDLAHKNATEELKRVLDYEEKMIAPVVQLGNMLEIPLPRRIEAFDISNISGTDITASMVVFENGKPRRSEYKRFKITDMFHQDDYASMRQVLMRRFAHLIAADRGFDKPPDLLLIDGGVAHAQVALNVLNELHLNYPVFGMVKDDRHRTRALVTPDGREIHIDGQQVVYALIGSVQEETHRFAISYHKKLRSNRLHYSELDKISGIGEKRKQDLLKRFKSIKGISNAELFELEQYLPKTAAKAVYNHFREKEREDASN